MECFRKLLSIIGPVVLSFTFHGCVPQQGLISGKPDGIGNCELVTIGSGREIIVSHVLGELWQAVLCPPAPIGTVVNVAALTSEILDTLVRTGIPLWETISHKNNIRIGAFGIRRNIRAVTFGERILRQYVPGSPSITA